MDVFDLIPRAMALGILEILTDETIMGKAYETHHHKISDGICYFNLATGKLESSFLDFDGAPFLELYRIEKSNPFCFETHCEVCFVRFQTLETQYFDVGLNDEEDNEHSLLTDIISDQEMCDHRSFRDLCAVQKPVNRELVIRMLNIFYS